MSDDQDQKQPSTDTAEELEERQEDWDPMMPETTVPDPAADQAIGEEDWQEWKEMSEEERPA